jgi:hypothetical protein
VEGGQYFTFWANNQEAYTLNLQLPLAVTTFAANVMDMIGIELMTWGNLILNRSLEQYIFGDQQ